MEIDGKFCEVDDILEKYFESDCFAEDGTESMISSLQIEDQLPVTTTQLVEIIDKIKSTNPTVASSEILDAGSLNSKLKNKFDALIYRKSPVFSESSADKSWSEFHKSISSITAELEADLQMTKCFILLLCIKYFDSILCFMLSKEKLTKKCTKKLTDDETEIVAYIGGSIIGKLRSKLSNNNSAFEIITSMTTTIDTSTNIMTKMYDRGGLTHINKKTVDFFFGLELCFRRMYQSNQIHINLSKLKYRETCQSNTLIRSDFFEACQSEIHSDDDIQEIMVRCIDIYFITRAHHKCRRMIEYFTAECKGKKTKACKSLRKELKKKAGNPIDTQMF